MFYCDSFMKDCVFYCEAAEAIVIASQTENTLTCFAVYSERNILLQDILLKSIGEEIEKVVFAFTPKNLEGLQMNVIDNEDDTLFVLGEKENIFERNQVMLPILSHA